jgi:hypothetical protein
MFALPKIMGSKFPCRFLAGEPLKFAAILLSRFRPKTKGVRRTTMSDLRHRFDENVYDLNAILHPGSVFDHPRDVLADATLSRAEKRAILASWASDAAAVGLARPCAPCDPLKQQLFR